MSAGSVEGCSAESKNGDGNTIATGGRLLWERPRSTIPMQGVEERPGFPEKREARSYTRVRVHSMGSQRTKLSQA